jgi:hypothetical protein
MGVKEFVTVRRPCKKARKRSGALREVCTVAGSVLYLSLAAAHAQDPVKVDPQHHKVEFENEQVRVLRITYGPREKDAGMHEHPNFLVVPLTDYQVKIAFPDGKTEEGSGKAGQAIWWPATRHVVENMSDAPIEVLAVEMKGKSAGAAKNTTVRER